MTNEGNDPMPSSARRVQSFRQSNPQGEGFWDLAALLRRVADTIEAIPDFRVDDLVLHSVETSVSEDQYITVYYHVADDEELELARLLGRS